MSGTRWFGHSLDELFGRRGRRSVVRSPPTSERACRDDRVMFAEILTASAVLEIGDIPVDLLSRCRSDERKDLKPEVGHHPSAENEPMTTVIGNRIAERPVAEISVDRSPPPAFTGEEISDEALFTLFEAVRLAPSSCSSQPWRFLYGKRGTAWFETFLRLLSEHNQIWAKNAALLMVLISKSTFTPAGQTQTTPRRDHWSDTSAAWSNFAHQAGLSGWHAHGIGDFNVERACAELNIPSDFHFDAAIAIGRRADTSFLPETGENSNGHEPAAGVIPEGGFPQPP